MKAIILAAGEGTRLRPLTLNKPKCLVEYKGKAILDYQLDVMRQCRLDNILIIKGYKAETIEREGTISIFNPRFHDTNMVHSLFCAQDHFNDDLLISYGDIIYGKSILDAVLQSPEDFAVSVSLNWRELWQKRMEDPLQDAETLKLDALGRITELGKKPKSYDEIQGQYMGIFKISKSLLPRIQSIYHSMDRNARYDGKTFDQMFMTSFIQYLIDKDIPVSAVRVRSEWLEIDALDDLKVECNIS